MTVDSLPLGGSGSYPTTVASLPPGGVGIIPNDRSQFATRGGFEIILNGSLGMILTHPGGKLATVVGYDSDPLGANWLRSLGMIPTALEANCLRSLGMITQGGG